MRERRIDSWEGGEAHNPPKKGRFGTDVMETDGEGSPESSLPSGAGRCTSVGGRTYEE